MWETLFFFSARTHKSMYIFDQHESAVTVSEILHKYNYMLNDIMCNTMLNNTKRSGIYIQFVSFMSFCQV
jgi:hypothetical protein